MDCTCIDEGGRESRSLGAGFEHRSGRGTKTVQGLDCANTTKVGLIAVSVPFAAQLLPLDIPAPPQTGPCESPQTIQTSPGAHMCLGRGTSHFVRPSTYPGLRMPEYTEFSLTTFYAFIRRTCSLSEFHKPVRTQSR